MKRYIIATILLLGHYSMAISDESSWDISCQSNSGVEIEGSFATKDKQMMIFTIISGDQQDEYITQKLLSAIEESPFVSYFLQGLFSPDATPVNGDYLFDKEYGVFFLKLSGVKGSDILRIIADPKTMKVLPNNTEAYNFMAKVSFIPKKTKSVSANKKESIMKCGMSFAE